MVNPTGPAVINQRYSFWLFLLAVAQRQSRRGHLVLGTLPRSRESAAVRTDHRCRIFARGRKRADGMGTELLSTLAIRGGGYEYSAARGISAIAAGWLAESAVIRFQMILASPRTAL